MRERLRGKPVCGVHVCVGGCLCVGVPSPWKHTATIYRREPRTPRFLWLSWVTQAHLRVTSFSGLLQDSGQQQLGAPHMPEAQSELEACQIFQDGKSQQPGSPKTQDPGKAGRSLLPHTLGWRLNGSHRNAFPSALSGKILVLNVPLRSQPSFPS